MPISGLNKNKRPFGRFFVSLQNTMCFVKIKSQTWVPVSSTGMTREKNWIATCSFAMIKGMYGCEVVRILIN